MAVASAYRVRVRTCRPYCDDTITKGDGVADEQRETGTALAPKWDASGLITAVASDAETGELLMVAHMNA